MNRRLLIVVIIIAAVAIAAAFGAWRAFAPEEPVLDNNQGNNNPSNNGNGGNSANGNAVGNGNQVFCTQDVKECPDGSYVSRVPPTCEFAPCP